MTSSIERVKTAIQALNQGKLVILTDHPTRENEGDLIFPAEKITPEIMNFIIRNSSGIVCLSMSSEYFKRLGLDYMVAPHLNSSSRGTPFTVSIEARDGITTGVSAKDRVQTILTATKDQVTLDEIVKPGHVFPLWAKDGGVLERPGHTEGAVDLMQLAGFKKAAVLCELMNADGSMMKGEHLKTFAVQHQLNILSIDDLLIYRRIYENLIAEESSADLPTEKFESFTITVIKEKYNNLEHLILLPKNKPLAEKPLVRIHSSCMTGDLFGSLRCDCQKQLNYSMDKIRQEGGLLIYLNQEGRGIGLFNKIKTYALQEQGLDTVEANQKLGLESDARDYYLAANILRNLKVSAVRLLTNNPLKIEGLKKYGVKEVEACQLPIFTNPQNKNYLKTKKEKLNHLITEVL